MPHFANMSGWHPPCARCLLGSTRGSRQHCLAAPWVQALAWVVSTDYTWVYVYCILYKINAYIYMYVYVYVYVCVYIYIYVCICVYIYTHILTKHVRDGHRWSRIVQTSGKRWNLPKYRYNDTTQVALWSRSWTLSFERYRPNLPHCIWDCSNVPSY